MLRVSARKAMTRLTATVDAVFEVLAKPRIRAPVSVEKGASPTVDVTKSLPEVRYALLGPDDIELDVRDGDGNTLTLSTGPVTTTTTFVVLASKPGAVSWRVALTIKVGEG
ncbi:MAG: hypothetical protein JNK04_00775 [Myxococcales bacterium]|nr:hypothetical protein [Myxococcales bacterium]